MTAISAIHLVTELASRRHIRYQLLPDQANINEAANLTCEGSTRA
jgi:hypothetical protein